MSEDKKTITKGLARAIKNFPREYCSFCERNTKVEGIFGLFYCPNAHIRIKADKEEVIVQPISNNIMATNVYKTYSDRLVRKPK